MSDQVMAETGEIVHVPSEATAIERMGAAEKVARVCKAMVQATAVNIQGKQYPPVECWQAIANAHGCTLAAKDVERIEGGIKATGEVRKIDTGQVIAQAEGFVGDDEPTWSKRPEYAKRAMAQTRAMSRAGRSAFAYIVVLMRIPGMKVTPAEEVPREGFDAAPVALPKRDSAKGAGAKAPLATPPSAEAQEKPGARDAEAEANLAFEGEIPEELPAGAELRVGVVSAVTTKNGKKKDGSSWTKHGIKCGEDWFGTFDKKLGEKAKSFEKLQAKIYWVPDGDYKTLVKIEEA